MIGIGGHHNSVSDVGVVSPTQQHSNRMIVGVKMTLKKKKDAKKNNRVHPSKTLNILKTSLKNEGGNADISCHLDEHMITETSNQT